MVFFVSEIGPLARVLRQKKTDIFFREGERICYYFTFLLLSFQFSVGGAETFLHKHQINLLNRKQIKRNFPDS